MGCAGGSDTVTSGTASDTSATGVSVSNHVTMGRTLITDLIIDELI